jgi:hypothetical protein
MTQKVDPEKTKIIIVSDIRGNKPNSIPFGLNLAKFLQAEVDIIHNIDARSVHGVPSSYSDSQTLKPGVKLSYDKIIEREIIKGNSILDEVLSKEASKLNYPLTINKVVKAGRIDEEINDSLVHNALNIVLINENVDDYIFHSQKEIIELIEGLEAISLLIPSTQKFQPFKEIAFITDFSNNFGLNLLSRITVPLQQMNSEITFIDVARPRKYSEKRLKCENWKEQAKNDFWGEIKTTVLKGKNHAQVLQEYIETTKPDLIIYSYRKLGFIDRIFHSSFLEKLLLQKQYPVLYLK